MIRWVCAFVSPVSSATLSISSVFVIGRPSSFVGTTSLTLRHRGGDSFQTAHARPVSSRYSSGMFRRLTVTLLGAGALLGCSVAQAAASTPLPPTSFYGYAAAKWAAANGWVMPDTRTAYAPASALLRLGAARVLVQENH